MSAPDTRAARAGPSDCASTSAQPYKGRPRNPALARPFAEFGGVEAHPGVHEQAAALMHGLAANPPFVDGNKRVALAATLVFLRLNGYRLALSLEQRYALTMRVADGSLSQEGLAEVLRGAID